MFTSHLSYRARSLPAAQTESPSPLPSVRTMRGETVKTQDADVMFNSTAGGVQK